MKPSLRPCCVLLALSQVPVLFAQPTPPSPTPEDIVTLSPFEVKSGTDNSYTSTSSTTGTRIASSIKELPFTVNVVTSQFMRDFAAFNLQEQMAFIPGFGMREGQGNYTLRGAGQGGAGMLRNGFFRAGMIDMVDIDRVEVIKGPAAAIYGRTSPGGIINFLTKRPRNKWEANFTQSFGGYDLSRSEASITGPIVPDKLSFRFDSAYYDTGSVVADMGTRQKVFSGSVKYNIGPNTTLFVEIEKVTRKDRLGEFHNVWYSTDGTANGITRIADELRSFNNQVPDAYTYREVTTTDFSLEHRFSPTLTARLSGQIFGRNLTVFQVVSSDIYNASTGIIGGRQPTLRTNPERADGIQAEILKEFDVGKTHHKFLTTYDYTWDKNGTDHVIQLPGALLSNTAYNIQNLSVANPNYYVDKNFADYTNITRDRGTKIKVNGLFMSDRITAFDNKLVALIGGRYDNVNNLFYNTLSNPQQHSRATTNQITRQFGVNYTPVKEVTLFVNNATSFVNQTFGNLPELASGTVVPPERGKSTEVGVKSAFMDGKIGVEVAAYQQERFDIGRSTTVTPSTPDGVSFTGEEHSKGIEIAWNANVTKNLLLFGSASWLRSKQDAIPLDPGLIGYPVTNVPPRQWALGGRYDFREGALKSLFFTAGVFTVGEQLFDTSSGVRRTIKQPGFTTVDVGTGYTVSRTGRFEHLIRFNVKNLLDESYYTGSKKTANGRQYIVRYVLAFK